MVRNRAQNRAVGKRRGKKDVSQLFNFLPNSYLERTSRPVYAIGFLLPFIIFYELGTIFINTDTLNQSQVRVVAFVWLQNFLEYLGFASKFAWMAPPFVVVIILVALQLTSRKRWSFFRGDIIPMAVECILLAVPLIVLSLFLNGPVRERIDSGQFVLESAPVQTGTVVGSSIASDSLVIISSQVPDEQVKEGRPFLADVITGIGAGIYEELVFRLILICVLMLLFQDVMRFSHKHSAVFSVLLSAALFSAHHHIIFIDGQLSFSAPFNLTEFAFRTIAGVYFAVLFAIRGFGITAGTHAFYDIIAVSINAVFFQH
jgi:hypothetical protein